jgi:hypothetical protein
MSTPIPNQAEMCEKSAVSVLAIAGQRSIWAVTFPGGKAIDNIG